jgi:hypothetical protein
MPMTSYVTDGERDNVLNFWDNRIAAGVT